MASAKSAPFSADLIEQRRASVPAITFPEALPVSAARDDIAAAIRDHQVVVVAGETGSGKTTQLPKICLELGRGVDGMIGHTQPRRLAARAVAERVAEETHTELGTAVGYSVRFTDRVSPTTLVKVMTDGILLRELVHDKLLRAYDTIIIDEAHERSLNIDFILGYLKQLLPCRPDLKVIITSATIDPQRFADHFATDTAPVPIIEVSGRTFPVEVRYRPLVADPDSVDGDHRDLDQIQAINAAVDELIRHGPGDILVFLATEREIRETAQSLRRLTNVEVLPLFARLSAAEQHRVFATGTQRRIVLSTNVAETSLTVPGIRYVVDAGTARISRYSTRTKVQRLPIEPISQASARQRSGRCGRVAEGVAIRLYSEADFQTRPEFTDPEILRTNLAAVILQMISLGLGQIEQFPFVQAPDQKAIRDGLTLLDELGALAPSKGGPATLSRIGKQLAKIPADPRLARMLLEAHTNGALREMLIIVAALSLPDVRERPADHRDAADAAHRRFTVPGSEFAAHVQLWDYLEEKRNELSGNQFRRTCEREYLHWVRIREWRDLHRQLSRITDSLGWKPNSSPADARAVGISVLAGLLSQIGQRDGDTRDYLGARGTKFAIFPGSSMSRKPPQYVMAAELVETSRLWARTVAAIEPEWAEKLAPHLCKRTYSEPHWSSKRMAAQAYERVTLFGVTLVAQRRVNYGPIDPPVAREMFIRHALVEGQWRTHHKFFTHNRQLLDDVDALEERARRRDLKVSEDDLFEFYDERIGPDVVSGSHFDTWWKKQRRTDPDLLTLTPESVAAAAVDDVDLTAYPTAWQQGQSTLALTYCYEPGTDEDGITVRIPLSLLTSVRAAGFDWLVPGMRHELATELIRSLPKQLRRQVVPAPDVATAALAALTARSEPITVGLAREITRLTGAVISPDDFAPDTLDPHLRARFAVIDADGTILAADRDLATLKRDFAKQAQSARPRSDSPTFDTWTEQTIGTVATTVEQTLAGQQVTGYPAPTLTDDGVRVVVHPTASAQRASMIPAVRHLVNLALPARGANTLAGLPPRQRAALSQAPYSSPAALVADCQRAAVNSLVTQPVWNATQFDSLLEQVRSDVGARIQEIVGAVAEIFVEYSHTLTALETCCRGPNSAIAADAVADVREQLDDMVFDGFIAATGIHQLVHIPRYLRAATARLTAFPASQGRDAQAMAALDRVVARWVNHAQSQPPGRRDAINESAHWMVEELRIALFAERVGTLYPVSEKRVVRAISELT